MPVTTVSDGPAARALAAHLNDPSRDTVTVVVTSAAGCDRPYVDAARLSAEIGDLADVYVMPTGSVSWEFSAAMPPDTQVYGGAGRVYPAGVAWIHDVHRSRLRFAYGAAEGAGATTRLIGDVFEATAAVGYEAPPPSSPPVTARGVVLGTPTDSEALAQLTDGTYATIRTAALFADLASSQIFQKGMVVRGRYDPSTHRLDPSPHLPSPASRLVDVADDDVVPVLVSSVEAASCRVSVLPTLSVDLPRAAVTGNPHDDLTDLLTPGEVVLARATRLPDGRIAWSMLDVDDDVSARPALAIWPGGPPWLAPRAADVPPAPSAPPRPTAPPASASSPPEAPAEHRPTPRVLDRARPGDPERSAEPPPETLPPVTAPVTATPAVLATRRAVPAVPAQPAPHAVPAPPLERGRAVRDLSLSLTAAQALAQKHRAEAEENRAAAEQHRAAAENAEQQLSHLMHELSRLERDLSDAHRALQAKGEELSRLRTTYRKTLAKERRGGGPADPEFADPCEQFRWEVLTSWARRIPAAEKAARPLTNFVLGEQFLPSLDALEGVSRSKVVDVVVEVLTGLAEHSAGRDLHQLRSGPGGSDEPVRRGDATCWRVSLQTKTPSARRLHFWRDGETIELSRVVVHDDFRP